jgi:hypothetical protein
MDTEAQPRFEKEKEDAFFIYFIAILMLSDYLTSYIYKKEL